MADDQRGFVRFRFLPRVFMAVASSVPPDEIRERKASLRTRMREERARLAPEVREAFGRQACAHVLTHAEAIGLDPGHPAVVAAYWPVGSEADCRPLLETLHERGFPCVLPSVVGRGLPLVFRAWRPRDQLLSGPLGTRQPAVTAPERIPGVLVVPLLAYDRHGRRLGQGGGYYDRTLAALRRRGPVVAIGFAFGLQEVASLPATDDDERLDWVATETGVLRCAGGEDA